MKPLSVLVASLAAICWASCSFGVEPTSSEDLFDTPEPQQPIPGSEVKIFRVAPRTRDNCEGWVQIGFVDPQDITNGNLVILDSKPNGKYDEEAIKELIGVLSYEVVPTEPVVVKNTRVDDPELPVMFPRSRMKKVLGENGHEKSIFTYSVGCEPMQAKEEKPNKSFKRDG